MSITCSSSRSTAYDTNGVLHFSDHLTGSGAVDAYSLPQWLPNLSPLIADQFNVLIRSQF